MADKNIKRNINKPVQYRDIADDGQQRPTNMAGPSVEALDRQS